MKQIFKKQKVRRAHLLSRHVTIFILAFILPVTILLLVCNVVSAFSLIGATKEAYHQILTYFVDAMDESLDRLDMYLVKTSREDYDFGCIVFSQDNQEYDYHLRRVYLRLQEDIDFYPLVQYFFLYDAAYDKTILVHSPYQKTDIAEMTHHETVEFIKTYLQDGSDSVQEWTIVDINGEKSLLRTLTFGTANFGALISVSRILQELDQYNLQNCTISINREDEAQNVHTGPLGYNLEILSRTGGFCMEFSFQGHIIFAKFRIVYAFLAAISILMLLMAFLSRTYLHRLVLIPIQTLTNRIQRVQEGDLETELPEALGCQEMNLVAKTFNEMLRQIKGLQVRIYEEKLLAQKLELQCLCLQLRPHFFLNTLNMIYVLSRNKQTELIGQVILNLTQYFRSVFQSDVNCIPLSEEVSRCISYINIYKIRCDSQFAIAFDVPEELRSYMVPHLCIQTFLENSTKYAHADINHLQMWTTARLRPQSNGHPFLELRIRDNGAGFSEQSLEMLNSTDYYKNTDGEHIGIKNLWHRLRLLYGEGAYLRFYNSPKGGAVVTVGFPAKQETQGGRDYAE